jgi:hypothetical protein
MASTPGKRVEVLNPEIQWEFTIPDGIPEVNIGVYAWEKLRRVCRTLSKSGLKVTPVIPPEYTALFRRIDPAQYTPPPAFPWKNP